MSAFKRSSLRRVLFSSIGDHNPASPELRDSTHAKSRRRNESAKASLLHELEDCESSSGNGSTSAASPPSIEVDDLLMATSSSSQISPLPDLLITHSSGIMVENDPEVDSLGSSPCIFTNPSVPREDKPRMMPRPRILQFDDSTMDTKNVHDYDIEMSSDRHEGTTDHFMHPATPGFKHDHRDVPSSPILMTLNLSDSPRSPRTLISRSRRTQLYTDKIPLSSPIACTPLRYATQAQSRASGILESPSHLTKSHFKSRIGFTTKRHTLQRDGLDSSLHAAVRGRNSSGSLTPLSSEKKRPRFSEKISPRSSLLYANVNPYTPNGQLLRLSAAKRVRQSLTSHNGSLLGGDGDGSLVMTSDTASVSYEMDCQLNQQFDNRTTSINMNQSPGKFDLNDGAVIIPQDIRTTEEFIPTKRLDFGADSSPISRFETEWIRCGQIGHGQFGTVFKCINKLDGCTYAIKRTKRNERHHSIGSGLAASRLLNEIWAHAVLGSMDRIVRFHTAWYEHGHVFIQTELCEGGSVSREVERMRQAGDKYDEVVLKRIMQHVAQGLNFIHAQNLVHMDVKPDNILISRVSQVSGYRSSNTIITSLVNESSDDGFETDESELADSGKVIYKIGDLGHVTCINEPDVEEGDFRYVAGEVFFNEDYSNLPKADIFALGMSIYDVAGGGPLPTNGEVWTSQRRGNIECLKNYSREFNDLIKKCVHQEPKERPSAGELAHALLPVECKSKAQLRRELDEARRKNEILIHQLSVANQLIAREQHTFHSHLSEMSSSGEHEDDEEERERDALVEYEKKHSFLINNVSPPTIRRSSIPSLAMANVDIGSIQIADNMQRLVQDNCNSKKLAPPSKWTRRKSNAAF